MRTILAVFLILLLVPSCEKDEGTQNELFWSNEKLDQSQPLLSELPMDLTKVIAVIAFGADMPEVYNPTFEYYTTTSDVRIRAVCSGTVIRKTFNERFQDYSIVLLPKPNSAWTIIYDHILNCPAKVGDAIVAGAEIGSIGTGNRIELQVNKVVTGSSEISVCPLMVAGPAFIIAHNELLQRILQGQQYSFGWCIKTIVTE
ncbi:MAG: hypothetical protein CVT97_00205 [Bacteroidetes bacterium HGW-Bacteroidetes-14]|jgi:hypothetical protein|nr:MAG: hypothetical protein CVT97_00205 [Bacteroidetes bacterium HGW-Bacteroidetes-14]